MEESQNFKERHRTRNFKTWKLEEKKYLKNYNNNNNNNIVVLLSSKEV